MFTLTSKIALITVLCFAVSVRAQPPDNRPAGRPKNCSPALAFFDDTLRASLENLAPETVFRYNEREDLAVNFKSRKFMLHQLEKDEKNPKKGRYLEAIESNSPDAEGFYLGANSQDATGWSFREVKENSETRLYWKVRTWEALVRGAKGNQEKLGVWCTFGPLISPQIEKAISDAFAATQKRYGLPTPPVILEPSMAEVESRLLMRLRDLVPIEKLETIRDNPTQARIGYLSRKFTVYYSRPNGEFSPNAHEELGPTGKGFVIELQKGDVYVNGGARLFTEAPEKLELHQEPYWARQQWHFDMDAKTAIYCDVKFGRALDAEVVKKIVQAMRDAGGKQ